MEEDKQMSVAFDVELADKTLVEVSMLVKVSSDLRYSLAFDRIKSFDIQRLVNSFRQQIELELRKDGSKTYRGASIDG